MITEIAIADAYAAAWEFTRGGPEPINDWSGYKAHPALPGSRNGRYTDDTMRSIANLRVMLSGEHDSPLAYIRETKRIFIEDNRDGWSKGFKSFLTTQVGNPDEAWLRDISRRGTNGALMGAAVCGLMPTMAAARGAARTQAEISHDDQAATCAEAVGALSFGIRTGEIDGRFCFDFLLDAFPNIRITKTIGPVDMSATETLMAACKELSCRVSIRGIIDGVIRRGGDTDSASAIATGIAASAPGAYLNDLPRWAYEDLDERSPRTNEVLRELSVREITLSHPETTFIVDS